MTDTPEFSRTISLLELSVIVPARNEERSLAACLASLVSQSEPGFALGEQWELIVVDDDSSDRTREIAAEMAVAHPGVTVLAAPPFDASITGKNSACWSGAQSARGRWLLFTDADTVHEPGDLSRSLREAERHQVKLLSYSPRQIVSGFSQRSVMPLIFSELASVYPPKKVSDPQSRLAAANGQFLLVDREAYFTAGGHRAIASEVLEDVALAENIKRHPWLIRFRYAPEALSARMYRTTGEMVEGWTKNLALLLPSPVSLAAWRVLDLLLFFGLPILSFTVPEHIPYQAAVFWLLWIRTCFRFYNRVMRANFPALDTVLSILGVPLFVYLLLRSVMQHRIQRRVVWKGRSYGSSVR